MPPSVPLDPGAALDVVVDELTLAGLPLDGARFFDRGHRIVFDWPAADWATDKAEVELRFESIEAGTLIAVEQRRSSWRAASGSGCGRSANRP